MSFSSLEYINFYTSNVAFASISARSISALITSFGSSSISVTYSSNSAELQKKFITFQHEPAQFASSPNGNVRACRVFGA